MLSRVRRTASPRKARLFGVACGYRVWQYLADPRERPAVEVAERFADGQATVAELQAARNARPPGMGDDEWSRGYLFHHLTAEDVREVFTLWRIGVRIGQKAGLGWRTQVIAIGDLVRCIFGSPFRPVNADPAWLTSTVVALAAGIYAERAFDRLPILADALQDAGCNSADVLAHCRGTGPHVRGCWVVDSLLGKT
jgi:hypothetical protein